MAQDSRKMTHIDDPNVSRSIAFSSRPEPRYWWHQGFDAPYVPDVYSVLSDAEWALMMKWFEETDELYGPGTGECSVPAISFLLSLVNGNGLTRIAQLGHFVGYSSLLIGMALRRMGQGKMVSIDIDASVTTFTRKYIEQAGLTKFAQLVVGDSASPVSAGQVVGLLGGSPQLVFIDSAHTARHTVEELNVWFPLVQPGGFVILHDASIFSEQWDTTGGGGVREGLRLFNEQSAQNRLGINEDFHGRGHQGRGSLTYLDGCGLAIIQKPLKP